MRRRARFRCLVAIFEYSSQRFSKQNVPLYWIKIESFLLLFMLNRWKLYLTWHGDINYKRNSELQWWMPRFRWSLCCRSFENLVTLEWFGFGATHTSCFANIISPIFSDKGRIRSYSFLNGFAAKDVLFFFVSSFENAYGETLVRLKNIVTMIVISQL